MMPKYVSMSAARSQRISTLYIARVHGYIYPTLAENENGILEEYFSISRQVKHGECIIIQKEEDNRFLDEWDIDPLKYFIEESTLLVYPYVVVDFEVEKGLAELNVLYNKYLRKNNNLSLEEESGGYYASKAFTTVKLLSSTRQIHSDVLRFMKTHDTVALSRSKLPYQQEEKVNLFHPFSQSIVQRIGPIFDFPSAVLTDYPKKIALMQNPILLSISISHSAASPNGASYLSHIVQKNLSECAVFFQATFLSIDARQLMHYEVFSKAAQNSQSQTSSQRSQPSNYFSAVQTIQSAIASDAKNISLSSEVIDVILRSAPCILLVESLDSIIIEENSGPMAANMTISMSSEERFMRSFSVFLNDLYSGMVIDSEKSVGSDRSDDVIDKVIVFVSTAAESKMKPSSKAIFSSIIPYNYAVDIAEVAEEIHEQVNSSRDSNGIRFDNERTFKEFCRVIAQQISTVSGAVTKDKLINDFRANTLLARRANAWLKNSGHLTSKKAENKSSLRWDGKHCDGFDTSSIDGKEVLNIIAKKKDIRNFFVGLKESAIQPSADSNQTFAVNWSDIGGLDSVRQEILDVLELPFQYPELFNSSCPRRQGVLLYGPPGTGKTLVAKAIATECGMSFLSVKGPELLDMYVGESERNVRELFENARRSAPCILFFDEIDSLAPARARGSDSAGGVMDRIVSQLLTEMDNLSKHAGATSSEASQHTYDEPESEYDISKTPSSIPSTVYNHGAVDESIYTSATSPSSSVQNNSINSCSKEILYDDIYANHESSELTSVAILLDTAIVGPKIGLISSSTEAGVLSPPLSPIRVQFDGHDSEKKPESAARAKEFNSKAAADSGMVFVIAATNRPDLLDPALMRPGRFDRKIYLGANSDHHAKVQIFRAQTRKFQMASCVDFGRIVRYLSEERGVPELTGADIGSITSAAYTIAMERTLDLLVKEAILSSQSSAQDSRAVKDALDRVSVSSVLFSNDVRVLNMDSKAIISCIKAYIDSLPSSRLKVAVSQRDLIAAAAKCKPTPIDKKYYQQLSQTYQDSGS